MFVAPDVSRRPYRSAMDAHLARFEKLLASQHGLITLAQLRQGELKEHQRQRLVRKRVLARCRPRVFALVGAPDTWERGLLAAVLSIDGSVASHSSAARLWGMQPRPEDRYEVTIGRRYRAEVRGVVFHSSLALDDEDVVRRQGIDCTSFERTLCDCAAMLSEFPASRALDDGLRRGVASLRRLSSCAERLESGPGRHMSVIRSLLAARGIGFDPGGSRSELELLDVFRRAQLPPPVQQLRVQVGNNTYRPDFAWPDHQVFAEYYGLPFHVGASAVVSDSRRLTALSAAGWLPLVFTHRSSDAEIVERTTEALRRRGVVRDFGA
jgi:hypothetical protein